MQRILTSITQLATCALLSLGFAAQAQEKADPTGAWTWNMAARQGGQERQVTLKLKLEGEKLTGTISGRQTETAIEEARIKGNDITFKVTREFQGNRVVQKYTGKIDGNLIKGKIETERAGQTQTVDWEAKRAPATAG